MASTLRQRTFKRIARISLIANPIGLNFRLRFHILSFILFTQPHLIFMLVSIIIESLRNGLKITFLMLLISLII